MATKIDGIMIVESYQEYYVQWETLAEPIYCETLEEAANLKEDTGGEILTCTVYRTVLVPFVTDEGDEMGAAGTNPRLGDS